MAQKKWLVALSAWLVTSLMSFILSLSGCGGGKVSTSLSPSVSNPPEAPSKESIVTARFFVDVKTRQVTVTPISGKSKTTKGRTVFTGTAINFITSTLLDHPGNPGIKVIKVALVNKTNLTIGQFSNGVVTGVRVLFSSINPVGSFSDLRPFVTVSTFAGTGNAGTDDGHVLSATFSQPSGVAVDGSGNLYVTDYNGHRVRKIQGSFVSTLAGSGVAGYANGVGTSASFNGPLGIAFNPVDNSLVVTDFLGNRIRRVTLDGRVSLIAGTGVAGDADGAGDVAQFSRPLGVAVDRRGVIYVSESSKHRIRKIVFTGNDPTNPSHYTVSTLAGSGVAGFADGVGTAARFNVPCGLAVSDDGTIYVADQGNKRIRLVSQSGEVVTIAGTGESGSDDGSGEAAKFTVPYGIVWVNGSLIVSESSAHVLRQVRLKEQNASEGRASSWLVQTIAGSSGVSGSVDGSGYDARFNIPRLLAVDRSGNIYVADAYNHKIRKVTPNSGFFPVGLATGSASSETVRLWNADGYYPNPSGEPVAYVEYSGVLKGGAMSEAKEWAFVVPKGVTAFEFTVTVEANTVGTPPDAGDSNVGSPNVLVRTILWNEKGGTGGFDVTGNADGPLALARFGIIADIDVDRFGNLYIADNWRRSIRRISANGIVTTIAGGRDGYQDGPGNVARFGSAFNLAVSPDGTEIFCTDLSKHVIRRVALIPGSDPTNPANWIVSTIAGVPDGVPGFNNGAGDVARFAGPLGIAMDEGGNLYVTETEGWDYRYDPPKLVGGHRVRVIVFKGGDRSDPKSWEVRSVAGDPAGNEGDADGVGKDARFSNPTRIVVDRWGNLYVSEWQKRRIRKITNALGYDLFSSYGSGVVTTFVNNLAGGIAVDAAGYLYVATNYRVYRVSPSGSISVVAGTGEPGAQDGPGNTAKFNLLGAIAVDSSGNIYVSDNEYRSEFPNIFNLRLRIIQRVIGSGSP